jgi:hypothetical protein
MVLLFDYLFSERNSDFIYDKFVKSLEWDDIIDDWILILLLMVENVKIQNKRGCRMVEGILL